MDVSGAVVVILSFQWFFVTWSANRSHHLLCCGGGYWEVFGLNHLSWFLEAVVRRRMMMVMIGRSVDDVWVQEHTRRCLTN
jgi:hypothetical protein